jgi:hypothetical protein
MLGRAARVRRLRPDPRASTRVTRVRVRLEAQTNGRRGLAHRIPPAGVPAVQIPARRPIARGIRAPAPRSPALGARPLPRGHHARLVLRPLIAVLFRAHLRARSRLVLAPQRGMLAATLRARTVVPRVLGRRTAMRVDRAVTGVVREAVQGPLATTRMTVSRMTVSRVTVRRAPVQVVRVPAASVPVIGPTAPMPSRRRRIGGAAASIGRRSQSFPRTSTSHCWIARFGQSCAP